MNSLRVSHYLNSVTLKRDEVADFDCYPFSIPAVRELKTLEFHPKLTFFVGENGSGKSTLLEGIAERLGYADSSNFSRSFRRWSGVTPREFRLRTDEPTG